MTFWLSRLAFSFLIIGGALAYHAWRAWTGQAPPLPAWQIYLEFFAAFVCLVLFAAGLRARHRPMP